MDKKEKVTQILVTAGVVIVFVITMVLSLYLDGMYHAYILEPLKGLFQ